MKRFFAAVITLSIMLLMAACTIPTITIPDFQGVDLTSVKANLGGKGLLVVVDYEYSDDVPIGNIIRTEPAAGEKVAKESRVTIFISKGPSEVPLKNGIIRWRHITSPSYNNGLEDYWTFDGLIYEDRLLLMCGACIATKNVRLAGFGTATTNNTVSPVPIKLLNQNKEPIENLTLTYGQPVGFIISLPLADLGSDRPTYVECGLTYYKGTDTTQYTLYLTFQLSW